LHSTNHIVAQTCSKGRVDIYLLAIGGLAILNCSDWWQCFVDNMNFQAQALPCHLRAETPAIPYSMVVKVDVLYYKYENCSHY